MKKAKDLPIYSRRLFPEQMGTSWMKDSSLVHKWHNYSKTNT